MSLGKLRYTILIIFLAQRFLQEVIFSIKMGFVEKALFFQKNKNYFTYKKIEDGYFITWVEDEKKNMFAPLLNVKKYLRISYTKKVKIMFL